MTLRVALVGGPMYDPLYALFRDEVEVVVHADHPGLNREVAGLLAAGERIDLLSTHSKYAPSQRQWLRSLDDLVDPPALAALAPLAVGLCRYEGALISVPRLIDVRVQWYRSDRLAPPPGSWADVLATSAAFGFPGRESGLFGTFFELVAGVGGQLFDGDGFPTLDTSEAQFAADLMCRLAVLCPSDLTSWHYDEVDAALHDGRIDAAGIWPGGVAPLRTSTAGPHLRPAPYPAGEQRRVSYGGVHSWAIPTTCGDVAAAVALLHRLIGHQAAALDASGGSMASHVPTMAGIEPVDDIDALRLDITRQTIAESMITYPSHERFPAFEDTGWGLLRKMLQGQVRAAEIPARLQDAAGRLLV